MQIIHQTIQNIQVGPAQSFDGLTMWPLVGENTNGGPDYISLDEALEKELAEVTEISELGSVPELLFKNGATKPVLLVDGEELVGAKQMDGTTWSINVRAGRTGNRRKNCSGVNDYPHKFSIVEEEVIK